MREEILKEIYCIEPFDLLERDHIADAIAWIDSGVELFRLSKPANPPKHLVAYVVVVNSGFVLLVDHKDAQRWLPTGGHVEPDEHPRETVAREIFEELGYEADHPIGPPLMLTVTETVGNSAGHTDVSLWYVVQGRRNQPISFETAEFNGVAWFEFARLPCNSDPYLGKFVSKLTGNSSARASDSAQCGTDT